MTAKKPRRTGRPSQFAAQQIREQILDIAAELFLAHGYGATSIEAIAQRAGISKRTFYHRFADKAELFAAVVHRLIERLRPANAAPLFKGESLSAILHKVAGLILRAALSPQALALQRIIISEATRFPELAVILDDEGSRREAVTRIAGLLGHYQKTGELALENTEFAAEQFLQMIVSVPQRRALGIGAPMTQAELDAWVHHAVELFLNGCKSRS